MIISFYFLCVHKAQFPPCKELGRKFGWAQSTSYYLSDIGAEFSRRKVTERRSVNFFKCLRFL